MPHCALCVNVCVLHNVCTPSEKVDKGYQDVLIFFHQGICFILRFMEVEPCEKNAPSVLREWKKP